MRAGADVVVDGADELVAVGEALVEVALGQPGRPADRPDGDTGAGGVTQQRHPGGEQGGTAGGTAVGE
ncbi:hypothetical protein [Actinokineospora sp. PR83]|uniref:hypothetical protein n=1 Tax=Actinokineospora sp. PR83 TaxID=2884908 RepID=UPI0035AB95B9